MMMMIAMSRDSSVGIALSYGLQGRVSSFRFLAGAVNFSPHHGVQNGSGTHPASYAMGTTVSMGVQRPGRQTDHSPPYSAEVKESVELYIHSHNAPSWRDARLKKHTDDFTFIYVLNSNLSFKILCHPSFLNERK
jgi:hypothetical protein